MMEAGRSGHGNMTDTMSNDLRALNRTVKSMTPSEGAHVSFMEQNGLLQICFMTSGCSLGQEGSCTMCNYGLTDCTEYDARQELSRILDDQGDRDIILLGTSGSILDESEFRRDRLESVIDEIRSRELIRTVILEASYRFVDDNALEKLSALNDRDVIVEMGLESSNPLVLDRCLCKDVDLERIKECIHRIKKHGFKVYLNVIFGSPLLSIEEQKEDARNTIKWANEQGADGIVLFPLNVKPNTLLWSMEKSGAYILPSHMELIDMLSGIEDSSLGKIFLSWTNPDSNIEVFRHMPTGYSPDVGQLYESFARTNDPVERHRMLTEFEKGASGADNPCRDGLKNAVAGQYLKLMGPRPSSFKKHIDRTEELSKVMRRLDDEMSQGGMAVVGITGPPYIGKRTFARRLASELCAERNLRMTFLDATAAIPDLTKIPNKSIIVVSNLDTTSGLDDDMLKSELENLWNSISDKGSILIYTAFRAPDIGVSLSLNYLDSKRAFDLLVGESDVLTGIGLSQDDLETTMTALKLTEPAAITALAHYIDSETDTDRGHLCDMILNWKTVLRPLVSDVVFLDTEARIDRMVDRSRRELLDILSINNDMKQYIRSFLKMCLNRDPTSDSEVLRDHSLIQYMVRDDDENVGYSCFLLAFHRLVHEAYIESVGRWCRTFALLYRGIAALGLTKRKDQLTIVRSNSRILINAMDKLVEHIVDYGQGQELKAEINKTTRLCRISGQTGPEAQDDKLTVDGLGSEDVELLRWIGKIIQSEEREFAAGCANIYFAHICPTHMDQRALVQNTVLCEYVDVERPVFLLLKTLWDLDVFDSSLSYACSTMHRASDYVRSEKIDDRFEKLEQIMVLTEVEAQMCALLFRDSGPDLMLQFNRSATLLREHAGRLKTIKTRKDLEYYIHLRCYMSLGSHLSNISANCPGLRIGSDDPYVSFFEELSRIMGAEQDIIRFTEQMSSNRYNFEIHDIWNGFDKTMINKFGDKANTRNIKVLNIILRPDAIVKSSLTMILRDYALLMSYMGEFEKSDELFDASEKLYQQYKHELGLPNLYMMRIQSLIFRKTGDVPLTKIRGWYDECIRLATPLYLRRIIALVNLEMARYCLRDHNLKGESKRYIRLASETLNRSYERHSSIWDVKKEIDGDYERIVNDDLVAAERMYHIAADDLVTPWMNMTTLSKQYRAGILLKDTELASENQNALIEYLNSRWAVRMRPSFDAILHNMRLEGDDWH